MENVTIEKLYKEKKDFLELTLLTAEEGLKKKILNNEIHRPGLALSGYTDRFAHERTQVIGETELSFLQSLDQNKRKQLLENVFRFEIPCVIISKNLYPPSELLEIANRNHIPVFHSRLSTAELTNRLSLYLDNIFAPHMTIHGTLVDVYGMGLLYTGKSGIGKSECALDLVERGHRLVADDMVNIIRKTPEIVIGTGNELLGHLMEIRGVGIIDIEKLFGIRAIRIQKRIEVEVRLVLWEDDLEYERLGIEDKYTRILGVEIPVVTIPISPGKNITVISEVIAMNHMLKVYGQEPAKEFSRRLINEISRKKRVSDYLESDLE
ncbi:MAG: HPr(Ser) kinase/phosphatase [candidate division Zixibacteria bacterium]|nr:HPr(Ser) kinase/phosphatase [candidate division Zixibacteria bacterium]